MSGRAHVVLLHLKVTRLCSQHSTTCMKTMSINKWHQRWAGRWVSNMGLNHFFEDLNLGNMKDWSEIIDQFSSLSLHDDFVTVTFLLYLKRNWFFLWMLDQAVWKVFTCDHVCLKVHLMWPLDLPMSISCALPPLLICSVSSPSLSADSGYTIQIRWRSAWLSCTCGPPRAHSKSKVTLITMFNLPLSQ